MVSDQQTDADVYAIREVVRLLYASISGPADQAPDWDLNASLFAPVGRSLVVHTRADGSRHLELLTCDEFRRSRDAYLSTHAFYEIETHSDVIVEGNIAHVMSYYASRHNLDDAPFEHGVNSIELVRLDGMWRVVFIMWEAGQIAQSLRRRQ